MLMAGGLAWTKCEERQRGERISCQAQGPLEEGRRDRGGEARRLGGKGENQIRFTALNLLDFTGSVSHGQQIFVPPAIFQDSLS